MQTEQQLKDSSYSLALKSRHIGIDFETDFTQISRHFNAGENLYCPYLKVQKLGTVFKAAVQAVQCDCLLLHRKRGGALAQISTSLGIVSEISTVI
jgi:hypothetical protein